LLAVLAALPHGGFTWRATSAVQADILFFFKVSMTRLHAVAENRCKSFVIACIQTGWWRVISLGRLLTALPDR
jgi:hypothetical protein